MTPEPFRPAASGWHRSAPEAPTPAALPALRCCQNQITDCNRIISVSSGNLWY